MIQLPVLWLVRLFSPTITLDSCWKPSQSVKIQGHYPVPIHRQTALRDLPHRGGDLFVTERIAQRVLSLPMIPKITGSNWRTCRPAGQAWSQPLPQH
jgi:DegT/DnrJ/EryC1/StrS aminotransferase family